MSTEIRRTCLDCGQGFVIDENERALFDHLREHIPEGNGGKGWHLPHRCLHCRAARRRARYDEPPAQATDNLILTCRECGAEFRFAGRDAEFWARNGWGRPKRCRPCREARRAGRAGA